MKHIKSYENIQEKYKESQFSEYIAWRSNTDIKIVKNNHKIKFFQQDKNQPVLEITHLYTYDTIDKSLTKIDDNSNEKITGIFLAPDTLPKFLYQSDNVQDCIDMLTLLSTANKYNL